MGASKTPVPLLDKLLPSLSILGLVVGIAAILIAFSTTGSPKIAYIKSDELLQKYQGMIDAKAKFEDKAKDWQANTDTLKAEFEASLKAYEKATATLSPNERAAKEKELRAKQEEYGKYSQAINQQAEQEDKKLTEGVLAQVNAYLKVYGQKHGYDIILGANGGTVVHGSDTYDITDEVLVELNKQYAGN